VAWTASRSLSRSGRRISRGVSSVAGIATSLPACTPLTPLPMRAEGSVPTGARSARASDLCQDDGNGEVLTPLEITGLHRVFTIHGGRDIADA
jgi:hypothetical protein